MVKKSVYIVFLVFLISCQKQEIKQYPLTYDFAYFPLDSGLWRQYDVTSITIDSLLKYYDTIHYQLLEVNSGWFINATNDSTMRIDLFRRNNSNHSWKPFSVWQAYINENDAFQFEDNNLYLKIKYPLAENATWDGDAYNRTDTADEYRYTISGLNVPASVNDLSFDSVLTVMQKNKSTNIDKVINYERYAAGIGLIEKQQMNISSATSDTSIHIDITKPVEDRIMEGTMYYQKIIAYGRY